jgi:hypothetical protein
MGDDLEAWNETYKDDTYVMLALVFDGESAKLKLKFKAEEDAWFWAAKKGRNYVFDFGLGEEEYDEKDVPSPIRKLIGSRGGGPNGNAAKLPAKKLMIRGYSRRPYAEYASGWNSRGRRPDEFLPQGLYVQLANMYLRAMGVPAYL